MFHLARRGEGEISCHLERNERLANEVERSRFLHFQTLSTKLCSVGMTAGRFFARRGEGDDKKELVGMTKRETQKQNR